MYKYIKNYIPQYWKKQATQSKKWAEDLNNQFSREDKQMVN